MKFIFKSSLAIILVFVTLRCVSGNEPPVFITEPVTIVTEFELYYYMVIASDPDPEDTLKFILDSDSDWLFLTDYGNDTALLAGFPVDYFSTEPLTLGVTGGQDTTWQTFEITLSCINTAPTIISEPVLSTYVDSTYLYQLFGVDFYSPILFNVIAKPDWISLSQTIDNSALLSGVPALSDTGISRIIIEARRANEICEAVAIQDFEIEVNRIIFNGQKIITNHSGFLISPNPATGYLRINLPQNSSQSSVIIRNIDGKLLKQDVLSGSDILYDISFLDTGVYLISVESNGEYFKKLQVIN